MFPGQVANFFCRGLLIFLVNWQSKSDDPMGFPSPAADYQEEVIDLGKELVKHPSTTFFFRVQGDSMVNANIPDQALLVVDRAMKACSGDIIVAVVNGELTVRRLVRTSRALVLHPENPVYKPLIVTREMNMTVWGTVTAIIIQPGKGK
jgi:DNA polymerase V